MRQVVVGNGVAGVTTARFLADRDPSLDVTIVSEEPYPYYPRPRLIDLVAGSASTDKMSVYPPAWYTQRGIKTLLGKRVTSITLGERHVLLSDGERLEYDNLVLATGARSFVPPIQGADLKGVYSLRSMDDAFGILERLRHIKHATMLGGGLLGLDLAVALRAHGVGVTVVELQPRLLPRQLDTEGAAILQRMIEDAGVEVITGDSCTAVEGSGIVQGVRTKSGRGWETGMVTISAGVRSNLDLPRAAGLDCHLGVQVDEHLQTSAPGVYAVGDVAEFQGRVWGIIPAALAQARVLADHLSGDSSAVYRDIVPSTTLKVTGIVLTSIGEVNPQEPGFQEVRDYNPNKGVYRKLVIRNGRVVGAIVLGERTSLRFINQLVDSQVNVAGHEDELLSGAFQVPTSVPSPSA
ncbi:MAG: NAD(P)/FAD-dependent oxidoreductase [Anaerolineae bacterium]